MIRLVVMLAFVLISLSPGGLVHAQEQTTIAPWAFEFKGGKFKPDLDQYDEFYGSDPSIFAAAMAYRLSNWYEVGFELDVMRDTGVGTFATNQTQGGRVRYTLVPAHLYVSVFGRFSPTQWVVPYVGLGASMAWYKQEIDTEPSRSGRTDFGYNARAGLQFLLNGLDQRTARRVAQDGLLNTYLFVEGQYFSTEVDGFDLGGVTYLLGFRLEFDFSD